MRIVTIAIGVVITHCWVQTLDAIPIVFLPICKTT